MVSVAVAAVVHELVGLKPVLTAIGGGGGGNMNLCALSDWVAVVVVVMTTNDVVAVVVVEVAMLLLIEEKISSFVVAMLGLVKCCPDDGAESAKRCSKFSECGAAAGSVPEGMPCTGQMPLLLLLLLLLVASKWNLCP